jgi:hypothetical protein
VIRTAVVLGLLFGSLGAIGNERYIVPVWGTSIQGAAGRYSSTLSITNLATETATVRVTGILPALSDDCATSCDNSQWTLQRQQTFVVDEGTEIVFNGKIVRLGAFVLESDQPVHIESEVYRYPAAVVTQTVSIARSWLPAGVSIIPRGAPLAPEGSSFRLYLVNPNDFTVRVAYSYGNRASAASVPAGSMAVLTLPVPGGSDTGASGSSRIAADVLESHGADITVSCDFPYLAATSSLAPSFRPAVVLALPLLR